MTRRAEFVSWLAPYFERFVAIKRAGGAKYNSQLLLLQALDRHVAADTSGAPFTREDLTTYVETLGRLSPRGRDNARCVIWQALAHAIVHGAEIERLPPRPPATPRWFRLRAPRLLSDEEIGVILREARRLAPVHGLRPATSATLLGLLVTTGMRIGEALALDIEDIDAEHGLLTVRHGKFDKARVIPVRDSTIEAIDRYLRHPRRTVGKCGADPVFVSIRRRRLSYCAAKLGLRHAYLQAGLDPETSPRLHDLRHTFAVGRVAAWYAAGKDVNALLPALSTYLGHVSVENTRTYLQANGALLEHANQRFETRTKSLDRRPL